MPFIVMPDYLLVMLFLLFAHFVADFIFQDDATAINKSKSLMVLSWHVLIYTFVLMTFVGAGNTFFIRPMLDPFFLMAFALVNGVSHFLVDLVTSKINAYLYSNNKRHLFFCTIGLDQFLHTAVLLISAVYLVI